ncbi:hypothetical protein BIY27_20725 [Gibbsiella quercinecans]|uniref:winged helix-turn-helix domain-containing protein n=1 Tax=Gibbsiella quercinecans TaxID=929813 RepID=UPI000EF283E9|nr:winged helix-turn-helix domain-containing protein [Gibbsiella quercinecans]RLM05647.1 hypothetical protein BIY27_20725 [Gibbsiella quercinecans]
MTNKFIINDNVIFIPNENRILSKDNHRKKIVLTTPASRCLQLLLEKQALVSQKELYEFAWGMKSQEVTPNNLYQNISILRKAFNAVSEDGKNLIITVPRKGFYFDKTAKIEKTTPHEKKSIKTRLNTGKIKKISKRSVSLAVLLTALIGTTLIPHRAIPSKAYSAHDKLVENVDGCHIYIHTEKSQGAIIPPEFKGRYCVADPHAINSSSWW